MNPALRHMAIIVLAMLSAVPGTAWAEDAIEVVAATVIMPAETPADPPVTDPGSADRVMRALALVGAPYKPGGASPETGFDCSGLVAWVFRDTVGYQLPRSADGLFNMRGMDRVQPVTQEELSTGDLVFFRIGRLGNRIDHVGIALGDGRFLHAPSRGGMVRLDSLDLPYWKKNYAGARRLPHALSVMAAPVKDREMAEANETVRVAGEDTP